MNCARVLPDKVKVARSFGRAAPDYDRYARLQRDVADTLLALGLPKQVSTVLDLGSGTGYCAGLLAQQFTGASIVSLDLAEGMLVHTLGREGQQTSVDAHFVCGDAEALPLADNSFDLVVSSLTLQWCQAPEKFFMELYRVMKPGAKALISTLAEQTLQELKASWEKVDGYVHVNHFLSMPDLLAALGDTPFSQCECSNTQEHYFYESLSGLTRELKGIGAHNLNSGQAMGLTGRQKIQALKQAFESQYQPGKGIPVTYDLVLIELEK